VSEHPGPIAGHKHTAAVEGDSGGRHDDAYLTNIAVTERLTYVDVGMCWRWPMKQALLHNRDS
jgi:hypothetical protein